MPLLAFLPALPGLIFGLLAWQAADPHHRLRTRFKLLFGLTLFGAGFPLFLLTASARLLARTDCVADSHFRGCASSSEAWGEVLFVGFQSGPLSLVPSLCIALPLAAASVAKAAYLMKKN